MEKVYVNVERYGNTPLPLSIALTKRTERVDKKERPNPPHHFGAGLTWGLPSEM